MKRLYHHRGHVIDVSVETVCRAPDGGATALDHIAVLLISADASPEHPDTQPYARLRIDRTTGRAFESEADALMGGYSVGRGIVDKLVDKTIDAS
ncbi:hypothetical protein [Paraburkholderia tropica]|uniref:hypothetical protein n=1 Tax=Paraburkholderia tropica TaxID=92647 RepID=UPI002ABD8146|nr:hypothetical protein [Paraburkholderia tropica]